MTPVHWRAWLAAILLFVLGIAVGVAGTAVLGGRAIRRVIQSPLTESGPAGRVVTRIGADLTEALQLTPAQAERVQAILDGSAVRMRAIRVRALRQAGAELRGAIKQIAAELPPEKQDELHRVIARRYQRLGLEPPVRPDANGQEDAE